MAATLTLPTAVAGWISSRPWLRVARADHASIAWDRWSAPIELIPTERGSDDDALWKRVEQRRRTGAPLPMVTASYLRADLRAELERRSIGYLDRRGNLHLPWQHGVVHIEAGSAQRRAARDTQPAAGGLGVHGVRAVQAVLSEGDALQVSHLASVAELSPSRTHAVLRLLEAEGLVRVTGTGPSTRRHVIDRSRLLDWLANQPVARRRERCLSVAIYARTPRDAWTAISRSLAHAQIPHGLTGAAAAAALGAGPTNVVVSSVRISPHVALEDAATALGADAGERGANVKLIRDTGMLGSVQTLERDHIRIAPPVRVYLDTLDERRGDDVAQGFRESVLGY